MLRFAMFVDGSNMFGQLNQMNLTVKRYDPFFHAVFQAAVKTWAPSLVGTAPIGRLVRVNWYALGQIDDLPDKVISDQNLQLKEFFERSDERKLLEAAAMRASPPATPATAYIKAWHAFIEERRAWYAGKRQFVEGLKKFNYAVCRDTDFVDIIECGRWKVDVEGKTVTEKGLDTKLAVDMIALEASYDVAILVTGDADLIPSVQLVKRLGKQVGVVELCPGSPPTDYAPGSSMRLKVASDFVIKLYASELLESGIGSAK